DQTFAALGKALQPALVAILPLVIKLAEGVQLLIGVLQELARIITGGVLFAFSGLAEAGAFVAKAHATVLKAAAAVADFFGGDNLAQVWRDRADAINAEAQALRNWAAASREVGGETFREIGTSTFRRPGTGTAEPVTPPKTEAQ